MGIDFRRPRHIRGFKFGETLIWDFTSRPLVEKTVSGSIAHITDGADEVPIKAWKVTLPASLTGYTAIHGTKNTGTGTPETQYTASLGRTIYGGTADIVNGEGQETYKRTKISDLSWVVQTVSGRSAFVSGQVTGLPTTSPKTVLCDVLPYDGEKTIGRMTNKTLVTWTNTFRVYDTDCADVTEFLSTYGNGYIVFQLKESEQTDFTFTPITPTPETALGVNNFWADEGDSSVTYYTYAD